MGLQQMLLGVGGISDGQQQFTSSNTGGQTFSWICPAGVTSVSAVCIGGGGGGGGGPNPQVGGSFKGGGGGACAYKNSISVTPGTSYTVVIGNRVYNANTSQSDGGDSYFINTSTVMAKGGQSVGASGNNGGQASACVGDGAYSGGDGGNVGVSSEGGEGSGSDGSPGTSTSSNAAGGNGGGGGGSTGTANGRGQGGNGSNNGQFIGAGGGGGGAGGFAGGGGGGGNIGTVTGTAATPGGSAFVNWYAGWGGNWGGGGAATAVNGGADVTRTGEGAVRLIWSVTGTARAFPGTNIGDL